MANAVMPLAFIEQGPDAGAYINLAAVCSIEHRKGHWDAMTPGYWITVSLAGGNKVDFFDEILSRGLLKVGISQNNLTVKA